MFEQEYLKDLLTRCRENVSRASREAKMNRSHLNVLLKKYGLR